MKNAQSLYKLSRREGLEKLVGTAARTSNHIYVLSEFVNEKCCLGKKDEYNTEECTVSLQDKQNKHGLYADSLCSKHMIGDKDKFLTLRKRKKWISLLRK